jgi:hypothetical protein
MIEFLRVIQRMKLPFLEKNAIMNRLRRRNMPVARVHFVVFVLFASLVTFLRPSFSQLSLDKCGDGTCDEVEKRTMKCPQDCPGREAAPQETLKPVRDYEEGHVLDYSPDADGFIWGTEVWPDRFDVAEGVINELLGTKYLKVRLGINNVSLDNRTFSNIACFPSVQNCRHQWDIDEVAGVFKQNGWSMMPMLSYGYHGVEAEATPADIEKYVDFVDWFVSTYKEDAGIKYLELENCPNCRASLAISKELLVEANNKIYDRVKGKFPDIMIGTAGFEFWIDQADNLSGNLEYFIDKANGAKFDFLAFHGYPLSEKIGMGFAHLPPTKTPVYNGYAGVAGILKLRSKLDENGWQERLIIDSEHGTIFPGVPYTEEEEEVDAAYYVQELLLKRVQKVNGRTALAGIFPMKTRVREKIGRVVGDISSGDLDSQGSPYLTMRAVSLLWSKLKNYNYSGHVSGEFDNENSAWVEEFRKDNKELYIFFKPFKYEIGQTVGFDDEILIYKLILERKPVSVTLTDISGNKQNLSLSQALLLEARNVPKYLEVEY